LDKIIQKDIIEPALDNLVNVFKAIVAPHFANILEVLTQVASKSE